MYYDYVVHGVPGEKKKKKKNLLEGEFIISGYAACA